MIRITAYFLMALFLAGCDTLSIFDLSPEDEEQQVVTDNKDDDYYLQIAKDLYVAKQYKQAYQIAICCRMIIEATDTPAFIASKSGNDHTLRFKIIYPEINRA